MTQNSKLRATEKLTFRRQDHVTDANWSLADVCVCYLYRSESAYSSSSSERYWTWHRESEAQKRCYVQPPQRRCKKRDPFIVRTFIKTRMCRRLANGRWIDGSIWFSYIQEISHFLINNINQRKFDNKKMALVWVNLFWHLFSHVSYLTTISIKKEPSKINCNTVT